MEELLKNCLFNSVDRRMNLFGYTHDGDSVMQGNISSVKTKLLTFNPTLWNVWDIPHCINLIIKHGWDKIHQIYPEFENNLRKIVQDSTSSIKLTDELK